MRTFAKKLKRFNDASDWLKSFYSAEGHMEIGKFTPAHGHISNAGPHQLQRIGTKICIWHFEKIAFFENNYWFVDNQGCAFNPKTGSSVDSRLYRIEDNDVRIGVSKKIHEDAV